MPQGSVHSPHRRFDRLFDLAGQQDRMTTAAQPGFTPVRVLAPHVEKRLRSDAIRSLGRTPNEEAVSDQPRNPVATTNFSELSDREAGGFTLATLAKRCFSTF